MTATNRPWSAEDARGVLATIAEPGPVLIALQALQHEFGYVHDEAVPMVAAAFNVSRADVYGVLTFYSDLRSTPPAEVEVRVCMGEACQSVGARGLLAAAETSMTADCDVQHVFCLGNCALGPAATVNGTLIGRATPPAVTAAIATEMRA
ncbi:MAG: NAD(P)H-dependent oxidoreductase subunit E [Actinomycetes bacterium]